DIVALIVTPSKYCPFAVAGRARMTASITAFPFSTSAFSSNENFPTGTATFPFLSSLSSPRPAFTSCTAFAVSSATVPALGFGINPRGPSIFPSFRTSAIAEAWLSPHQNLENPPDIFESCLSYRQILHLRPWLLSPPDPPRKQVSAP